MNIIHFSYDQQFTLCYQIKGYIATFKKVQSDWNRLKEWFSLCHCHLGIGQVFAEDSQPVKINSTNHNMCKNQKYISPVQYSSPVVQSSECIHPLINCTYSSKYWLVQGTIFLY